MPRPAQVWCSFFQRAWKLTISAGFFGLFWIANPMVMKLNTHTGTYKRKQMVEKLFPWLTIFDDVIRNSQCTSIFAAILIIILINLQRVAKTFFNFQKTHLIIINMYNGYLVITFTKVLIKCQNQQNFSKFHK